MKPKFYYSFLIFLFFSISSFAQQAANNSIVKTIYAYSFFNESTAPATDKLETEVKLLTGVIEVKVKLKPETSIGQLIVVVKEKKRSSEGDILFQPTDLKRILTKNGFTPNELTTEVAPN